MTSQPTTDIRSKLDEGNEFVRRFRELVAEAEAAGFGLDVDVEYNVDGRPESFDIDLNYRFNYIDTITNVTWG